MASGIYEIVNTQNGKRYVGSAVNLESRKSYHFSMLRKGNHDNAHIQHSYNKWGENAFEFHVVLECPPVELIAREQERIDGYDFNALYNISPTAGSPLGVKHSAETNAKNSATQKGRVVSAETRKKISEANKGKQNLLGHVHSPEAKAKMSASHTGRVFSDEHRANLSKAHKDPSPEIRSKMSAGQKGRVHGEETKAKIGAAGVGRIKSDETRAKLSAANMGHTVSAETRAKISASRKARFAKKRAE